MDPQGFLNLDKPAGLTSHDCVGIVRRVLRTRKVGHGGTLDPAATGVLPIAVGQATRFLSFLPQGKGYRATFVLGQTSSTDDAEGEILSCADASHLTLESVRSCLDRWQGWVDQVPPLYSAVRYQGKRLYELARSGLAASDIPIAARPVQIDQISILDWRPGAKAELDLDIRCGPGTYIRAIARDLGQELGCGGLMQQLRRVQSGCFQLESSVGLQAFQDHQDPHKALQPIAAVFADLAAVNLTSEQMWKWCHGQRLEWPDADQSLLQVWSGAEPRKFLGLGQISDQKLKHVRVLQDEN
ncbi:MAG: tRNA pseudouridine(55) synthase TruB [Synechococcaceae cyanobacterium SM2_3_1]|nr:tRNA pseudouridine(55) synthase TruB [Synechococcaceae cyanobacterium SM2_3_1]